MKLRKSHQEELWSIAKRGLATLAAVLAFWGTTAPTLFVVHSRYAGPSSTIVLIGCFRSSYSNLLTPNLSLRERKMGFILFYCCGSIAFDFVWRFCYLLLPRSQEDMKMDDISWKIIWWSFTVTDLWSDSALVTVFNLWRLLGDISGCIALFKYSSTVKEHKAFRQALLLFFLFGVLQLYNTTMYLFLCSYLDDFGNVDNNILSQFTFWALNGFFVVASAASALFSYQILFNM
eukprot:scaffold66_cov115-Cylindrotheca_fusiformis.AAC.16